MTDLAEIRVKLDKKSLELEHARRTFDKERQNVIDLEDNLADAEDAQKLLQDAATTVQQTAHAKISNVVARCLSAIFDDPYAFKIIFEQKRGKTEARLVFVRNGLELEDPLNECGGGPVDIGSFALRLACLVLQKPPLRRLLVLDEPFKNIRGKVYRDRVKTLLENLSEELGVQLVLNVDHEAYPQFALGHIVDLG